jgi:hypothetical protein
MTLPREGYYGSTVTWRSDTPSAIADDGTYQRITSAKSTLAVTLTATVTYHGETTVKTFTVYAVTTPSGDKKGSGGGGGGGGGGIPAYAAPGDGEPPVPLTEEEAARGSFRDVPQTHWARSYIDTLAARKIIGGTGGENFEPDRTVTREEFVKMLVSAFGYTLKPGAAAFADVSEDAWYADYVATAHKEGLINGVDGANFGVGQNITREDMAVLIARVLTVRNVDFTGAVTQFNDADAIADYAVTAVENLTMIGVLSGDEAGGFAPKRNATRAEAAKVLLTAMDKGGIR